MNKNIYFAFPRVLSTLLFALVRNNSPSIFVS